MLKKFLPKLKFINILYTLILTITILILPLKTAASSSSSTANQSSTLISSTATSQPVASQSQAKTDQINPPNITAQPDQKEIKTLEKGTLKIGTNATFYPFEYKNQLGEIDGFDIAVAKQIGKKLGLKVEIIDMPFEGLISAIGTKIDIAIAGITKTPEREKNVNFSDTYFKTKQCLLTLKNKNIKTKEELKGKNVGTQIGTTASEIASTISNIQPKNYDTYQDLINDLLTKRLDIVICDESTAFAYQEIYKNKIKQFDGSLFGFPEENYSIASSKENKNLLSAINTAITEIKNDKGPEGYNELITKYIKTKVSANIAIKQEKKGILKSLKAAFLDKGRFKQYIKGLSTTLQITFFAAIIGFVVGTGLAILKLKKNKKGKRTIIGKLANIYINLIRGTPLIVQLLIFWYVILKNVKSGVFVAILAFGLNSAAYVAEILRGGINSVNKGQTEAANAMGFNNLQTMRYVILPQALKNSIPALCNEFISLLKETAVAGYVAVEDLTRVANMISAASYEPFIPLFIVALMYFIITKSISIILNFVEKSIR